MEFSGQYLTYNEYRLLGGTLQETPFNLLEFEARRMIDINTQNRLKEADSEQIPQEVKLCEYNLINTIDGYANNVKNVTGKGNIASESIDGYSVSYVSSTSVKEIIASKNTELDDIIRTYLLGVIFNGEHIMYLGAK